ncbi:hypothetical protein ACWEOE_00910 [Amycolatopsis sp. NPDC004368]
MEHETDATLPAGPPLEAQLGELVRRTGINPTRPVTDEIDAEFFGGVRVDLVLDEALPGVRAWQPV